MAPAIEPALYKSCSGLQNQLYQARHDTGTEMGELTLNLGNVATLRAFRHGGGKQ